MIKNKISSKLKLSTLKYWKAFSIAAEQDSSNFKRRLFSNIDRINSWLKEIGLELCVKEIKKNMKIIIFSKNRAMQLEALLRSLPSEKLAITVIYTCTSNFYQKGYDKIIEGIDESLYHVIFSKENSNFGFREKLQKALNSEYLISFMVDDNIVYDSSFPGISLKQNECYSLRLHKGIKNPTHYNYTMSLDGNVYRIKDIHPLINNLNFDNPNQLESALQGRYGTNFKMKYGKGYLIGFNHNRVSNTSHCAFTGDFSEQELNKKFMDGYIIDFEAMCLKPTSNVHTSQKYLFKKAKI